MKKNVKQRIKGQCLICGKGTDRNLNGCFKPFCEACLIEFQDPKDKYRMIVTCPHCKATRSLAVISHYNYWRAVRRGQQPMCQLCPNRTRNRPKKFICRECGNPTQSYLLFCTKCFFKNRHPDDQHENIKKEQARYVYQCENPNCENTERVLTHKGLSKILVRKRDNPDYVYFCKPCSYIRRKQRNQAKSKTEIIYMNGCKLTKRRTGYARDEACTWCEHASECLKEISLFFWPAFSREKIKDTDRNEQKPVDFKSSAM